MPTCSLIAGLITQVCAGFASSLTALQCCAEELGRKAVQELKDSTGLNYSSCCVKHCASLHSKLADPHQWHAGSNSLQFMRLDITDQTSVKHFASALEHEFGGVTILVNNAGKFWTAAHHELLCRSSSSAYHLSSHDMPQCKQESTHHNLLPNLVYAARYVPWHVCSKPLHSLSAQLQHIAWQRLAASTQAGCVLQTKT